MCSCTWDAELKGAPPTKPGIFHHLPGPQLLFNGSQVRNAVILRFQCNCNMRRTFILLLILPRRHSNGNLQRTPAPAKRSANMSEHHFNNRTMRVDFQLNVNDPHVCLNNLTASEQPSAGRAVRINPASRCLWLKFARVSRVVQPSSEGTAVHNKYSGLK